MLQRLLFAFLCLVLLALAGAWFLVSTDRWPLDDRKQPALALWAANRAVGHFLLDHAEPAKLSACAQQMLDPQPEGLTPLEYAKVQRQLGLMAPKERLAIGGVAHLQPGPVGASGCGGGGRG